MSYVETTFNDLMVKVELTNCTKSPSSSRYSLHLNFLVSGVDDIIILTEDIVLRRRKVLQHLMGYLRLL